MNESFAERLDTISQALSYIYHDLPVLHTTAHFEVRVIYDPRTDYDMYGVINKETGVIEHCTNALTRAKYIADEATAEVLEGPLTTEKVVKRTMEQMGLSTESIDPVRSRSN